MEKKKRVLVALAEDLGSVYSTYMVVPPSITAAAEHLTPLTSTGTKHT